jgi:hypothetical protein
MTNRKKIIFFYIFLLTFLSSAFIFFIHSRPAVKVNYIERSETFYNNFSALNKLINYNSILRNNIFLLISDNEYFYSTDSILKKIHYYSLSMDSALNQLQIIKQTELINIKKDLDLHYKNILNLYYNDKKQEALNKFVEVFNPISLELTQKCYYYLNIEIKSHSEFLKSIEKGKQDLIFYIILILFLLTAGFIIFLRAFSQTEKNISKNYATLIIYKKLIRFIKIF